MQYFTSDLHYFHKNICKFTNRPWTQEENEECLIELHNSQVSEEDVVWHLGDFFFVNNSKPGLEKALSVLERLNGKFRLLFGNHDREDFFRGLVRRTDKILSIDYYKEIRLRYNGKRVKLVMCHYPMHVFNQSEYGSIMIHGHSHGFFHAPGRVIDVGLDGAYERLGEWRYWTEEDILSYGLNREIHQPY